MEIQTLKNQGDEDYRDQLNALINEHRVQLDEKQESFNELLANLREKHSKSICDLSTKQQDLASQIRQKDAKIDHLEQLLKMQKEDHQIEGQQLTQGVFAQMFELHQQYIQEINTLNKYI